MIHKEKNQLIFLQEMLFNNIYLKIKLIIILEKEKNKSNINKNNK